MTDTVAMIINAQTTEFPALAVLRNSVSDSYMYYARLQPREMSDDRVANGGQLEAAPIFWWGPQVA